MYLLSKRKRVFTGMLALLLVLASVLGCAKKEGGTAATNSPIVSSTVQPVQKVKLVWVSYGMLLGGKKEAILERWKKKYPNIEVEYKDFPSGDPYYPALDVALAGNETMDVFLMQAGNAPKRAQQGALLELDSLAKKDNFDIVENFGDGVKKVQFDGKNYVLPYDIDISMLYYNKDMFDAKGVKYPDENTTFDELSEMAKKLTTGQGNDKVWGFMPWGFGSPEALFPAQNAGWNWVKNEFTPNIADPRVKKALVWQKDLIDSGATPSFIQTSQEKMSTRLMFAQGKTAMIVANWWAPIFWSIQRYNNGTMGDEALKFKYDVTFTPRYDAQAKPRLYGVSPGWGFVTNAKTKYPYESYLLTKFLASEVFDILGAVPAYKKADPKLYDNIYNLFIDKNNVTHKDLYPANFIDKLKKVTGETVPLTTIYPTEKVDTGVVTSVQDIYRREIDQYFLGKQSVDEIIAKIQSQAEKEAAKLKK